jgi:hypothetical protein
MKAFGLESITPYLVNEAYFVKCIANSSAAIFFPGSIQHRDIKREGVSYEDDYQGNAMAATITPGKIEIRFHKDFSDDSVRSIFQSILALPDMRWASTFKVQYQGRTILS